MAETTVHGFSGRTAADRGAPLDRLDVLGDVLGASLPHEAITAGQAMSRTGMAYRRIIRASHRMCTSFHRQSTATPEAHPAQEPGIPSCTHLGTSAPAPERRLRGTLLTTPGGDKASATHLVLGPVCQAAPMKARALGAAVTLALSALAASCVDAGPLHQTAEITKVSPRLICTELVFSDGARGAHECWSRSLLDSHGTAEAGECVVLTERSVSATVVRAKPTSCPEEVDSTSS